jgi:outer membrane protein insertion porin family
MQCLCQGSKNLTCTQIDDNSTLPVTISSVHILHANRTRKSFLERVVNPLLSANNEEPYTLQEALEAVGGAVNKLNRFGAWISNETRTPV